MSAQPPRIAKRLLAWSLSASERDAVIGDFAEEYATRVARDGVHAARRWYRRQVWRSVAPNVRRRRGGPRVRPSANVFRPEAVMTDLRYAIRSLRGTPGFTAVALVVLTLGIGATTAIFSVVDAVVLRALPFDEHDRLVAVGERFSSDVLTPRADVLRPNTDPDRLTAIAPQNYLDWASQQQVFESMAAIAYGQFTLRDAETPPEDIRALRVTADFFDVIRIRPAIGRAFTSDSEIDGHHRVAILSDGLWRRRFGADPGIIGRSIPLDDDRYEVIGVMPPGVADVTRPVGVGTPQPNELWVPYVVPENERVRRPTSYSRYLQSIARLLPGVSIVQAQAQMDHIAAGIAQANPEVKWLEGTGIGVRPLHDHLVGTPTKSWMLMLLGAVGIVLLIACANVANLMLARASGRERDVAVRSALGAGRWRLIRQSLAESVLLSVAGTALAIIVGWWAVEILRGAMPDDVPRVSAIALDLRVLAAAAGLSLITGLAFGVVPALQTSQPDLTTALKDAARGTSAGRRRQLARASLVVAEVALAVVLLVGAALFIGSFAALMRIDPGFNPERVLTAFVAPPTNARLTFDQIVERLERTPGIVSAAVVAGGTPLTGFRFATRLTIPPAEPEAAVQIRYRTVTPEYHHVMGIPLQRGRLFESTDREGAPGVLIISAGAAATFFPGQDPVGRVVRFNGERTVVGVVGNVRQGSLEVEPEPEVYVPVAQLGAPTGELVVRTVGDPRETLPAIQAVLLEIVPTVPVRNIRTMDDVFAQHTAQRRLNMLLIGLFGVLGLVISAVGIYGVLAAIVSQRTREIGVRMALGATRSNVVGMVLAKTGALVALGLAIGSAGAWYLSATAEAFLFGLEPTEPRAFAAAIVTLLVAAFAASIIPARRAASVDPVVALRSE